MKSILIALSIGLFTLSGPLWAQAHDWRAGLEQSIPVNVEFATEYELRNERFLPIHFAVRIPRIEGVVTLQTRAMPSGNIFEARYLAPDGGFLEYLTISEGTAPGATDEERQQTLYDVIVEFIYPTLGFGEATEVLGGRHAVMGGQPAVELMAISSEPGQDVIVARIVGVVSPNGNNAVFFVQQTARDRMGLGGPGDMAQTYAGQVAASVSFVAYRDANNDIVPF